MLPRNIIRSIASTVHKFHTSVAATRKLKPAGTSSCLQICNKFNKQQSLSSCSVLRYYSQVANTESLAVVDYNYVKKATSKDDIIIIDVREPDEVKEHGKIPNSINIPLGTIDTSLAMSDKAFHDAFNRAKPTENTEVIFYCMIGKRSGKAQQSALNLGFKNAKNYLGSWTDWAVKSQ